MALQGLQGATASVKQQKTTKVFWFVDAESYRRELSARDRGSRSGSGSIDRTPIDLEISVTAAQPCDLRWMPLRCAKRWLCVAAFF